MGKTAITFATNEEDAFKYICTLETKLETAKNKYNTEKAKAEKALKEKLQAEAWEALLDGYLRAAEKTDRLAKEVSRGFNKTTMRSEVVCANAHYAYQAFQWMVDDMIKIADCVEDFKCEIDKCLNLLSNAPANDPLIVGLKKLQAAVNNALICLLEALKAWLAVLKQAQALAINVNDKVGLDSIFNALLVDFADDKSHLDYGGAKSWTTCEKPPRPFLPQTPINCSLEINNRMYICITKAELEQISTCLIAIRNTYSTAAQEMIKAKTEMESLEAALKVAKETNACKTK